MGRPEERGHGERPGSDTPGLDAPDNGPTSNGPTSNGPTSNDAAAEFAARIEEAEAHPLRRRSVVTRVLVVLVAGVAIYFVLPSIADVLGQWPRLSTLDPRWLVLAIVFELAHFACTFALQRLALRTRDWYPVVTAQLAGNAITLIVPGGAAAGAGVQFRMLANAGIDPTTAVGGLTAFSLLGVGGLLALPLFALPTILAGTPVNGGLVHAALLGLVGFVVFAGLAAVALSVDRPLAAAGRTIQRVRNRLRRSRPPLHDLDRRLIEERDEIRAVLGNRWRAAVLLSTGRLGLDFLCLVASLRASGAQARPALVLLAFAVAGVIGMVPITPGGLGIVEASLSGLLVLAGVGAGSAFLATLTYRLASYWLPLIAGPVAYLAYRRRYGTAPAAPAAPAGQRH